MPREPNVVVQLFRSVAEEPVFYLIVCFLIKYF